MDFPFYPHDSQAVKFITVKTFLMEEKKKKRIRVKFLMQYVQCDFTANV